jgi:uncharacterized protein (TIGR02996 family)
MFKTLTLALQAASEKLEKGSDEEALIALLHGWRLIKAPRIADAIDRVSERMTKARPPLGGEKTVKARHEAWLVLANKRNPADIGRLIAALWPAKWMDAYTFIESLVKAPDDPRIARALAELIHSTRYDSGSAFTLYAEVYRQLDKLGDLRQRPLLVEGMSPKFAWQDDGKRWAEEAVKKLDAAYPGGIVKLSAEEEAALTKVESHFAVTAKARTSSAKTEGEFLEAIYAAPDDDAPRAVFADWLTERGDPRGEFITLQLGPRSPASLKRETALLKAHGEKWAGVLGRILDKKLRVFERGFLAGGILDIKPDTKTLPDELSDPAWAIMTAVTAGYLLKEAKTPFGLKLLQHPCMNNVRVLKNFTLPTVAALAKSGERPRITEIFVGERDDDGVALVGFGPIPDVVGNSPYAEAVVEGTAFPNLKRFGAWIPLQGLTKLVSGKMGKRVESITLCDFSVPLGGLAALPQKLELPAVKELRLSNGNPAYPNLSWDFIVRRAPGDKDRGRFTKIHGQSLFGENKLPDPHELDRVLASLPPDGMTELTIQKAATSRNPYDAEDTAMLDKRLATFTNLKVIDVPWRR